MFNFFDPRLLRNRYSMICFFAGGTKAIAYGQIALLNRQSRLLYQN